MAAVDFSASGLLGELSINIVEGPDDYLYGEEKALLEVIEGRDPLPRLLAPYEVGLFATNPTVVNNVETLMSVTHIMANGVDWFRSMGTEASPGTIVATVVGDVVNPGVHEVEMGTPFTQLLELCGGPLPGRTFKAAGWARPALSSTTTRST